MEHINISDFALRDTITGYYLISNISVKTSRTNEPYLDATLSDRTGSIEAKAWRYYGDLSENANGSVVKVKAEVAEYKGNLQLLIRDEKGSACIKKASAESDIFDIELLLPVAPIDADAEYNYILSIINSMQDEDYKALCSEMIRINEKSFRKIPAGKFVHHDFVCGLLMHTANMLRMADFLAAQYSDTVSRDLLLAGTLLHDFAKASEFLVSEFGLVQDYSTEGMLIGHLVIGAMEITELSKKLNIPAEKAMLLSHLVLSHHGVPEHGAAVRPQIAEAELLSFIDLIDSRMEIFRGALEKTEVGKFSERIFGLDNRRVYKHRD